MALTSTPTSPGTQIVLWSLQSWKDACRSLPSFVPQSLKAPPTHPQRCTWPCKGAHTSGALLLGHYHWWLLSLQSTSWSENLRPLLHSSSSRLGLRMTLGRNWALWGMTRVESTCPGSLRCSALSMASRDSTLSGIALSRMVLQRGIGRWKRGLSPCFMSLGCPLPSGERALLRTVPGVMGVMTGLHHWGKSIIGWCQYRTSGRVKYCVPNGCT